MASYGAEGIDVLRLLALRDHLANGQSKGVRQSDVLSLQPTFIKEHWLAAVDAVDRAVEFVAERLAASAPFLVPSWTMILPLADALWDAHGARRTWKDDLETWSWRAALANTYAQGANTQAVADAKELRAWFHNPASQPPLVNAFRFSPESLLDLRRRNESVLRAILCLTVKLGARDWIRNEERLRDTDQSLDIHHIFPKKYLATNRIEESDYLANFAVLVKSTNTSLRNDPPSEVLNRDEVDSTAIESHRVPLNHLRANDYHEFIRDRQRSLVEAITEHLGIPVAEDSDDG